MYKIRPEDSNAMREKTNRRPQTIVRRRYDSMTDKKPQTQDNLRRRYAPPKKKDIANSAKTKYSVTMPQKEDPACQTYRKARSCGWDRGFHLTRCPPSQYRHRRCQHSTAWSPKPHRYSRRHRRDRCTRSPSRVQRTGPVASRRCTRVERSDRR